MNNLQMSLISKWFKMTKSGEKPEDYREITEYWFKRLVYNYKDVLISNGYNYGLNSDKEIYEFVTNYTTANCFVYKDFEANIMTLGYPKSTDLDRILIIEHKGIEIREGNPLWGAEIGKCYFVIKHGAILNNLKSKALDLKLDL